MGVEAYKQALSHVVYVLIDPRNAEVRYVGVSCRIKHRYGQHLRAVGHNYVARWIRSLQVEGLHPRLVVVQDGVATADRVTLEQWWIAFGRRQGWPLTNITKGGDGVWGWKMSADQRAQLSAFKKGKALPPEMHAKALLANTGRIKSPYERAVTSRTQKGRVKSPEERAKLSRSNKGRIVTPETRLKLSVAWERLSPEEQAARVALLKEASPVKRGQPRDPTAVAKTAAGLRGKKHPPEFGAKVSAAKKGKPGQLKSAETRAKISAAHKGRVFSPEHLANMSKVRLGKPGKPMTAERRAQQAAYKRNWWVQQRGARSDPPQLSLPFMSEGTPEWT